MAASVQGFLSIAELTMSKDTHTTPAPFREPPGLESFRSLPPCPLPPQTQIAGGSTDAVWKACEDYLQSEYTKQSLYLHYKEWLHAKQNPYLQGSFTHAIPAPTNVTTPVMPPGVFMPNVKSTNATKVSGVLQRVDSSHSLVSTTTGGSEGDKHEEQSLKSTTTPTKVRVEEQIRDLRVEHMENGGVKAQWRVDARKIRGKDKQIISPSFEIYPDSSFKLMVRPRCMGEKKGQANFSKACGCGVVDLKLMCAESTPKLRFRISVGGGAPRGPVEHDFRNNSVGGLAHSDEIFDFKSAVDPKSSTVLVCLEVFAESTQEQ